MALLSLRENHAIRFAGATHVVLEPPDFVARLAALVPRPRLQRVFSIDIETCPECGGKLRVIASIEEPALIRKILDHVQRREALPERVARGPPGERAAGSRLL